MSLSSVVPSSLVLVSVGLVASGCYQRHDRDVPTVPPRVDASSLDAGTATCVPIGSGIGVTVETDFPGTTCELGGFLGFPQRSFIEGESFVIELCVDETCSCRVTITGLSEPVRDALTRVMETVFDGFFELAPERAIIRNTSLCDGPPRDECPIVFEAETGFLRPDPELFRVGVRFGDVECVGECGAVRELVFALSFGERRDTVSVRRGEVGHVGASHFANLRSWNSCTDEPDIVTWAHWFL